MVVNPLHLDEAELHAIRDLKSGVRRIPVNAPIWETLIELGLVQPDPAVGTGSEHHMLTLAGLRYPTE